jgi:subtilisin family serine protease
MASPVVAGVAALIMSYYPQLTAAQVKQVILDSATRYPIQVRLPAQEEGGATTVPFSQLSITGGVVNAYAALQLAAQRAK